MVKILILELAPAILQKKKENNIYRSVTGNVETAVSPELGNPPQRRHNGGAMVRRPVLTASLLHALRDVPSPRRIGRLRGLVRTAGLASIIACGGFVLTVHFSARVMISHKAGAATII